MNSSDISTYDGIIRNLGNCKSMVVSRVVEHGRRTLMQYDVSHSRPRGETHLSSIPVRSPSHQIV